MIEAGNLSDFNLIRKRELSECNDTGIKDAVIGKADSFPLIYFLLTETTRFYTEQFAELQSHIMREKRLMVFETPSRVLMTHEYTIEDIGNLKNGFYFLFNVTERLSWLKILIEGNRVSIASKQKIIAYLKYKLGNELVELSNLLNSDVEATAYRLYEASDGKPCFVEFNQKENKGQQSILLSVTFFDSIRNKVLKKGTNILSPLREKSMAYKYNTLSNKASAWIYFKAPSNFVLSINYGDIPAHLIEASPSNDEEITSLVLKPNGETLSIVFDILVNVPPALKWWYNGLLYLSYTLCLICFIALLTSLFSTLPAEVINTLHNCVYAVVAALIATRGWLMSEEQVMKIISKCYTVLVCLLLAMAIGISITNYLGHKKNEVLTNIVPKRVIYLSQNNSFSEKGSVNNMTSSFQWLQMGDSSALGYWDSILHIDNPTLQNVPLFIKEIQGCGIEQHDSIIEINDK